MKIHLATIIAALAVSAFVSDGEVLAQTAEAKLFALYVNDKCAYSLESAEEIAAWPITWHSGEVVTAKAHDGTEYSLSTDDTTSAILPAQKGGIWVFVNSAQGSASVGVPWSLYGGDSLKLSSTRMDAFAMDTLQDGPDRSSQDRLIPPVAYTGDNWSGSASAQSTLTFTPPFGNKTELTFTGSGTTVFTFDKSGLWTLKLAMADTTEKQATLTIVPSGTVVSLL